MRANLATKKNGVQSQKVFGARFGIISMVGKGETKNIFPSEQKKR